jgi:Domain of unknown function (DUF4440)
MKHRVTLIFLMVFVTLFLCALSLSAKAQVAERSALFNTIMAKDAQLFEEGFNQCRLTRIEPIIAPDLKFFHDKAGMQNREQFFLAMKSNVCGNPEGKPVRTLLSGSTVIYALENNGVVYGAVQHGEHSFHLKNSDTTKAGYTLAKFTHVWLLNKDQWQLHTSISYDHQQKFGTLPMHSSNKIKAPVVTNLFQVQLAPFRLSLDYQLMN